MKIMLRRSKAYFYPVLLIIMLCLYCISFIYFNVFAFNHPFLGIDVIKENNEYRVVNIMPYSLGEKEDIEIADKIVSINQQPVETYHTVARWNFIEQASQIVVEKNDNSIQEINFQNRVPWLNIENISILSMISLIFIGSGTYSLFKNRYRSARVVYFILCYTIAIAAVAATSSGIGNKLAYSVIFVALSIIPALLFTIFRYFPQYYKSSSLAIINKYMYIAAGLLIFLFFTDLMLNEVYHPALKKVIIICSTIGVFLSIILLILRYFKNSNLELKNQLNILILGISISFLPVILISILPNMINGYIEKIPYRYPLLTFIFLPITFSYVMVKQKVIDINVHLPKLVSYVSLFLLSFLFYFLWQFTTRNILEIQNNVFLLNFFGISLLICVLLILYKFLFPFISRKIFGYHDQIQQHKNELFSKLKKNEHIDSILDFLLSSINQIVAVKAACIVIDKEREREFVKATGRFIGKENAILSISRCHNEKELDDKGIDYMIPIKYDSEVQGFVYLGEKINGSRLEKEELNKLTDLLDCGSSVIFSALSIHQLEREKKHLYKSNLIVQNEVSQLKMYNDCLLEAQEKERKEISNYLHDQILQNAILLKKSLESFIDVNENENLVIKTDHIHRAMTMSDRVVNEIREKCFDLYPAMIEDIGFVETCEYIFTNDRVYAGEASIIWSCNFTEKEAQQFSHSEQKVIFRCVKELVMNAIKHAKCTRIYVSFEKKNNQFMFSVKDNGKGFIQQDYHSKSFLENKHLGLVSVKQNIERIGGQLDIFSSKDKGTNLSIYVIKQFGQDMEKEVTREADSSVISG
jgi:two-component system sensor histidine kinase ComP